MGTWTNRGLWDAATITLGEPILRAALLRSVPSDATVRDWNTVANITASEVTTGQVANYARVTLTGVQVVQGDDGLVRLRCDDMPFGQLAPGATVAGVAIFRRTTIADQNTDPVWLVIPLADPTATNGGQFVVVTPDAGFAGWAPGFDAPTVDAGMDQTVNARTFTLSATASHPGVWTQLVGGAYSHKQAVVLAPRSATTGVVVADGDGPAVGIAYSTSPDRSNEQPLDGAVVTGPVYVFLAPDTVDAVGRVTWRLNGVLQRTDTAAPFDLLGPDPESPGDPLALGGIEGAHEVTGEVVLLNGVSVPTVAARFDVVEDTPVAQPTTWEPPADWDTTFTVVELEAADAVDGVIDVDMADDTDYLIVCLEPLPARVNLHGGRNVVWIGGEVNIGHQGDVPTPPAARVGVWVDDRHDGGGTSASGRVVHIEGVTITGVDLVAGVGCRDPEVVLRLANCRIGPCRSRSAADEAGTAPYWAAAQPGRGATPTALGPLLAVKEVQVDRCTFLTGGDGIVTRHQGQTDNQHPTWWLRRSNVRCVTYTSRGDRPGRPGNTGVRVATGATGLVLPAATVADDQLPGVFRLDNFWVGHPSRNPSQTVQRGNAGPGSNGDGSWSYATLSHPVLGGLWVRDWAGTAQGRFWNGDPPGVDFCPAGLAGMGYVTPGWE